MYKNKTLEICVVCNLEINEDDPEELGGECCNFCNKSICSECYDKEPPVDYYGWICKKCEIE